MFPCRQLVSCTAVALVEKEWLQEEWFHNCGSCVNGVGWHAVIFLWLSLQLH